jgi:protein FrlC
MVAFACPSRCATSSRLIHLSDSGRLALGQGTVDFRKLFQALKVADFDGLLTMEIGFDKRNVQADTLAQDTYDYVKNPAEESGA